MDYTCLIHETTDVWWVASVLGVTRPQGVPDRAETISILLDGSVEATISVRSTRWNFDDFGVQWGSKLSAETSTDASVDVLFNRLLRLSQVSGRGALLHQYDALVAWEGDRLVFNSDQSEWHRSRLRTLLAEHLPAATVEDRTDDYFWETGVFSPESRPELMSSAVSRLRDLVTEQQLDEIAGLGIGDPLDLDHIRAVALDYERRLNWFRYEEPIQETVVQVAPLLLAVLSKPPVLTRRLGAARQIIRSNETLADKALRPYEDALTAAIGPGPVNARPDPGEQERGAPSTEDTDH